MNVTRASAYAPSLKVWIEVEIHDGVLHRVDLRERRTESFPESPRHPVMARILRHLQTGREDFSDLNVDDSALTEMERAVIEDLRMLPAGKTTTYGDIAERIGRPRGSRAVGNAVGKNPFVIVVPCHRVVQKNGDLGGYSGCGGPVTKKRLLEIEGAIAKPVYLE